MQAETREERIEREAVEARQSLRLRAREALNFLEGFDPEKAKAIREGLALRTKENPQGADSLLERIVEEVIDTSLVEEGEEEVDRGKVFMAAPVTALGSLLDRDFPRVVRRLLGNKGLASHDLDFADAKDRAKDYIGGMRALSRLVNAGKSGHKATKGDQVQWTTWFALLTKTPFGEDLREAVFHLLLKRRAKRVLDTLVQDPGASWTILVETAEEEAREGALAVRHLKKFQREAPRRFRECIDLAKATALPQEKTGEKATSTVWTRVSRDGGKSWTVREEAFEAPRARGGTREVSFGVSEEALRKRLGERRWEALESEGLGLM
jgi:hypothetical protein